MPVTGSADRLTEAVDRLILKYRSVHSENQRLREKVDDLEKQLEYQQGNADSRGYNLLRIHYARLLSERTELKVRLERLLNQLNSLRDNPDRSTDD
ncbi:hypothetical protein CSA37_01755 [Candidatus Fermentibacteria bacterium]|nr:MAG: hypothetical protein CSA37_01755 [Candidatus Fermentibacteria bacterium]